MVQFRIIHAPVDQAKGPVRLRDQTTEIALGPHGAFESGNIGRLTQGVLANWVVSALPGRTRRTSPPPFTPLAARQPEP